jgi:protein-tyrosine phosphatase
MQVLFLCTGNYYRSRFAEAVFNFHAQRRGLSVRAVSRGLATHLIRDFPDRISPFTVSALRERAIPLEHTSVRPRQLANEDLAVSALIVAIKEEEHRPLLARLHPGWAERVEFWHIHDMDAGVPALQLPELEKKTLALLDTAAALA